MNFPRALSLRAIRFLCAVFGDDFSLEFLFVNESMNRSAEREREKETKQNEKGRKRSLSEIIIRKSQFFIIIFYSTEW